MKIGYFSDTHFEFQDRNVSKFLDSIARSDLDVLLLAGDISSLDVNARDRFITNVPDVIRQCNVRFKCLVYHVNGNHEFYGLDMEKYDPHFTQEIHGVGKFGGQYCQQIGSEYLLIACTLWTDYMLMGEGYKELAMIECNGMSDSRLIRHGGYPFVSSMAYALHVEDREFIEKSLDIAMSYKLRPIILTHHVPHVAAKNPKFPVDLFSAGFYCGDMLPVIEKAEEADCAAWIFGHHHWCINDHESFKFPLLSAQLGYRKEETGWSGLGVLEL